MNNTEARQGVFISTYGCQMNVNDTERMYALLEMTNFEPVSRPEDAELIIINACSVREKPVHKVRSEAGHYRKLKERNPNLKIGVGGCVGQQEKGKLLKDIPVIDFVFGTDSIDRLPSLVEEVKNSNKKIVSAEFNHKDPYQIQTLVRNPGVSTFVNITKGCDNFCTFCVVPFTRGRERSREFSEIFKDVQNLIARGVKEITFLGQNVNSYQSACGKRFPDLLEQVAKDTAIERIRFTSPHPKDFDGTVAKVMAENNQKIMECVHMPLQAGNSRILELMNRGYTREDFIAKAKMLKSFLPNAVFTTDIIVGFPGETEKEFEDTLTMLDEVEFENIFAFKYSPRPYTKAAKFENQLTEAVKSDRLSRLLAKHRLMAFDIAKKYLGQTLLVLVEEYHADTNSSFGRSTQNKAVHITTPGNFVGKTVPVKIVEAYPQTLHGEIVQ